MSEMLDKLERARFVAVQRLRRTDYYGADVLDHALLVASVVDGSVSVHCPVTPEGDPLDVEIGELSREEVDSETEDALAERIVGLVELALADGVLPRFSPST